MTPVAIKIGETIMKAQLKMLNHIAYISTSVLETTQLLNTIITDNKHLVSPVKTKWKCSHKQENNTEFDEYNNTYGIKTKGLYYIDPLASEFYRNYQYGNEFTLHKTEFGDWKVVLEKYHCDIMYGEREHLEYSISVTIKNSAMLKYFSNQVVTAFNHKVDSVLLKEEEQRIQNAKTRIAKTLLEV